MRGFYRSKSPEETFTSFPSKHKDQGKICFQEEDKKMSCIGKKANTKQNHLGSLSNPARCAGSTQLVAAPMDAPSGRSHAGRARIWSWSKGKEPAWKLQAVNQETHLLLFENSQKEARLFSNDKRSVEHILGFLLRMLATFCFRWTTNTYNQQ